MQGKYKIMEDRVMTLIRKHSDNMYPSFLDNFFSRDWMDWNNSNFSNTNTTLPAVNVKESDDLFEIEVAAPGMKKDDFKIDLDNNRLTISSEHKEENVDENDNYTRKEFSYQSFSRSFTIPENVVNGEKISAKYCDGVLCVKLPKREEVKPKPARQIKIS